MHGVPTHGTGGVPVEPGGDTLLAEDVLAVQHGGLLGALYSNNTVQ